MCHLSAKMLSSLLLFTALVAAVDSVTLVSLANYSKPIASICIAIPAPGESYQEDSDPVKKSDNPSKQDNVHPEKISRGSSTVKPEVPKTIPANDTWVLPKLDDSGKERASLQYYVKINGTAKPQFWAGETIIPNSHLTPGNHILTYEQIIVEDGKLSLKVWWDSEQMVFQKSSDREVNANLYEPSHVVFFGPPSLQKSAQALCYDPGQTTLAIVATSVLFALMLIGVVALVLVKRYCKADSLNIAGHSATEKEASNTVAGISGSNYEPSDNIAYQPVDSE